MINTDRPPKRPPAASPKTEQPSLEVHHPPHYNKGIEVITFIESWDLNFSRGSVIKYTCRGGVKNKNKEIEDLQKAQQYLQFEIDRIKRQQNEDS
jgi:hypothetical protein